LILLPFSFTVTSVCGYTTAKIFCIAACNKNQTARLEI